MLIRLWIVDTANDDAILEDLGNCICSAPNAALALFADDEQRWADKGYDTDLLWEVTE